MRRKTYISNKATLMFNVDEASNTGGVINGAWTMLIEKFEPPICIFRVARYPEKLHTLTDVVEGNKFDYQD